MNVRDSNKECQALMAFRDSPELSALNKLLKQFNLFEAIGVIHQELRHSDFLAFMLDPKQTHALGDQFAKKLFQELSKEQKFADLKNWTDFTESDLLKIIGAIKSQSWFKPPM